MKGNNCCFRDLVKNLSCWHAFTDSHIDEMILLEHGVIIDTTEFYILIQVCVTLTLIQDQRDARR